MQTGGVVTLDLFVVAKNTKECKNGTMLLALDAYDEKGKQFRVTAFDRAHDFFVTRISKDVAYKFCNCELRTSTYGNQENEIRMSMKSNVLPSSVTFDRTTAMDQTSCLLDAIQVKADMRVDITGIVTDIKTQEDATKKRRISLADESAELHVIACRDAAEIELETGQVYTFKRTKMNQNGTFYVFEAPSLATNEEKRKISEWYDEHKNDFVEIETLETFPINTLHNVQGRVDDVSGTIELSTTSKRTLTLRGTTHTIEVSLFGEAKDTDVCKGQIVQLNKAKLTDWNGISLMYYGHVHVVRDNVHLNEKYDSSQMSLPSLSRLPTPASAQVDEWSTCEEVCSKFNVGERCDVVGYISKKESSLSLVDETGSIGVCFHNFDTVPDEFTIVGIRKAQRVSSGIMVYNDLTIKYTDDSVTGKKEQIDSSSHPRSFACRSNLIKQHLNN